MPSSSVPSLESLRVLAACVRHGGFSQAAKALHLTPSAVSLRMRNLEATLGVKLFVRHGPKLDATESAIALAAKVDEALATIEAAVDHARRRRRPLRVTCAPTFATRWLIPRLAAYHATAGSQPIALDATDSVLGSDRFDVAIRAGRGPWRGFSSVELLPDEGTPMLSPSLADEASPLTPKRLLELPLIPDARWTRWFALAGLPDAVPTFASTRFTTYELEAIAAAKGVGVALLSPFLYADLVAQHALVAPFDTIVEGPQSYFALWREGAATPHFVRWIQKELAATRDAQNP
jgi:LysR family glycine cleavage system transcriptional activator